MQERTTPSTSSLLWAQWRQGLKTLQDAVLNPWQGVQQGRDEPGTIANPTPQMVTQDIQGKASYQSLLEEYSTRPAPAPEIERGRE